MGELPPGAMKTVTVSPGSSSWTSKGPGPFSAHTLWATWLIPSNSERQGRPASGGLGERDSRLPAAKVQPLDLMLAAAVPSQNFSKGRFPASVCHSISAFEALVF
ncbi:unnamed protein product [Pipistrellus nathusii]|uniref:Uncharacterized protein n=1 Tax=Pipistrellus nathusii TaxID=59473 RepID=A0ABN9ZIT0_PIPNA